MRLKAPQPVRSAVLALLAATLGLGGGPALALSIGAPRGSAVIGNPVQLTLPLTPDGAGEDLCARGELRQGDADPMPLDVRVETRAGQPVLVLASRGVVQEPAVTIAVTVGCTQPLARSFVLLSELPGSSGGALQREAEPAPRLALAPTLASLPAPNASPGPAAAPSPAPRAQATAPSPAPRAQATAPSPAPRAQAAAPSPAPRVQAATPARPKAAARQAAAPRPAPGHQGPRLRLEPIDIVIDSEPLLKVAPELAQAPAASTEQRDTARAAWQAVNTPPDLVAAQVQANELANTELRAMKATLDRHAADLRVLDESLARVSSERDFLRNTLLVVVAAGLLGFAWILRLYTRESALRRAWWEAEGQRASAAPEATPAPAAAERAEPAAAATAEEPAAAPQALPPVPATADPVVDKSRLATAVELLDIQEKAEFFLAVGQPGKAIELLEEQIHAPVGGSPFVWLDLLDLCRRLERRADYERVRTEFQKVFSTRMPQYETAAHGSQGLQGHPRALSRIMLLWPTRRVLKVIEDALQDNSGTDSVTFDLEASRELLLLYRIAQDVVGDNAEPDSFPKTVLAPLSSAPITEPVPLFALDGQGEATEPVDIDIGEMQSQPIGLEFDLDLPPPPQQRARVH